MFVTTQLSSDHPAHQGRHTLQLKLQKKKLSSIHTTTFFSQLLHAFNYRHTIIYYIYNNLLHACAFNNIIYGQQFSRYFLEKQFGKLLQCARTFRCLHYQEFQIILNYSHCLNMNQYLASFLIYTNNYYLDDFDVKKYIPSDLSWVKIQLVFGSIVSSIIMSYI